MNFSTDATPPSLPKLAAMPPNADAPRSSGALAGLSLMALGIALIGCAALIDARDSRAPWAGAVFSPEGDVPWDGTIPIRARRLSLQNYPIRQQIHRGLMDFFPPNELRALGLERTDWLIVVYAPVSTLEPLLASGRMPRPGYPEVLAGAFADRGDIYADDGHFQVVGRLARTASGLATAYVMPADEVWEPLFERTMTWGWLDPKGLEKVASAGDGAFAEDAEVYGMFPASHVSVWCSTAGLALAAVGGSVLHRAAFRRIRRGIFAPACRAFDAHPRIVRSMHVGMYGGFFLAMGVAVMVPQTNVMVMNIIRHAFTEGDLGYVGKAYQSGNVFAAAAATWANNYVLQTVLLTVLLSLVVPCAGVLKTLGNIGVAGLGMAPIWSGIASGYTFHSITIVLELEAYIYTCVAVVVFWMHVAAWIRERDRRPLKDGAMVLGSATLLAGAMLAIAGLYEAVTLIFLR